MMQPAERMEIEADLKLTLGVYVRVCVFVCVYVRACAYARARVCAYACVRVCAGERTRLCVPPSIPLFNLLLDSSGSGVSHDF